MAASVSIGRVGCMATATMFCQGPSEDGAGVGGATRVPCLVPLAPPPSSRCFHSAFLWSLLHSLTHIPSLAFLYVILNHGRTPRTDRRGHLRRPQGLEHLHHIHLLRHRRLPRLDHLRQCRRRYAPAATRTPGTSFVCEAARRVGHLQVPRDSPWLYVYSWVLHMCLN